MKFPAMDYAYKHGDARRLYLNVTNKCTNRCSFCVRYRTEGLGGAVLWGAEEPDFAKLQDAIHGQGTMEEFQEFIWCGYGEPTFRLDLIKEAASWLRSYGATIRLNTNGHACLIHGRDVIPELSQAVDDVSISLNAPNCRRYLQLCRPDLDSYPRSNDEIIDPRLFWDSMIDFLARSPQYFKRTQASVVGYMLTLEEIDQSKSLALSLGVRRFLVR
jgi:TatD family-associated radical SAM protein